MNRTKVAQIRVLRWDIRLRKPTSVDINQTLSDLDGLARQANNALDERLRIVEWITENYYIAATDRFKMVDKPVYDDRFMIGEQRSHAVAFNFQRLINKSQAGHSDAKSDQ